VTASVAHQSLEGREAHVDSGGGVVAHAGEMSAPVMQSHLFATLSLTCQCFDQRVRLSGS
jgi:hypothetical protein